MPQAPPHRDFRRSVVAALRSRTTELTRGWLDELEDRLYIERRALLPSADLLDGVPALLDRVLQSIADPDDELDDGLVEEKLDALVQVREQQGLGIEEVVAEFELLHGILIDASVEEMAGRWNDLPPEVPMHFALELQTALHRLS
ncbi:MAG: RsbRD N-terminal domain-containing protein, partial [Thermoanaerobaculia bacterium]|nr:RsbRD N-terminal domain-containing protein [Thermoanaerobaculia bacterium]